MDRLTVTTAVVFLLAITKSLLGDRIDCEKVYFGELDQMSLIECNVTDAKLFVYWFKGSETGTYPIVSYEAGKVEWREGSKDKYGLSDEQNLEIIDTKLNDEGNYTVRIYFGEFDYETVTTELKVYRPPDPPCLHIDSCDSNCGDCRLNISRTGELICHVYGSRPPINLHWIVTNQSEISFIDNGQDTQYDQVSSTFHTKKTITYSTGGCGSTASLTCEASVSEHLFEAVLDVRNRNVRIHSEACKDIIPGTLKPPTEGGKVVWPYICFAIVFLAIIVLLIICFTRRRKGKHGTIESNREYTELKTTDQEPKKPKDLKKELIDALVKYYEQHCFIKPLPWGEPIPIDALYTPCLCKFTNIKNEIVHQTSEYLSAPDFNFDCNRVFITADLGYGKTTFTLHLVTKWISHQRATNGQTQIKKDHSILIYLHLKEVTRTMILAEVVKRMLPTRSNLTCSGIDKVLQSNECQILLDGLDELSMSSKTEDTSEESPHDTDMLTIGDLLDNRINITKYKHLKVWVTTREVDDMNSGFALPYSKVNMLGFSEEQIIQYIHKTCRYYYEQKNAPGMDSFVQENALYSPINATNYKAVNQPSKTTKGMKEPAGDTQRKSEDLSATQNDSSVYNINEIEKSKSEMHSGNEETNELGEPRASTKLLEEVQEDEQDLKKLPSDSESNKSKRKKNEMSTEQENRAASATGTMETNEKAHGVFNTLKFVEENVNKFIEVNDIVKIFSKTPLLQIMIIHIITCRILDPTGRYREMNINKLTTVMRLVITCLESRYVQKVRKDSIKHDIQTLENKLGEIAFLNKLKVTLGKREFWDAKIGGEDVKTALEIGLLKYSKGIGRGDNQLENLAFSSYSGIEFYHEFFKEYLAAQYISENKTKWTWLDEFIKSSGDEATVRLLQFMFGMDKPKVDKAFKTLLGEKKMWNNLIDCIYEVGDPDKKKSMLVNIRNKSKRLAQITMLNIHYLERQHHRIAVTDFCQACNKNQIEITRMVFRESCAIDFLQDVTLPPVELLIFYEMKIDEEQFVAIITGLSKRYCPESLQFVACEVPKQLAGTGQQKVTAAMKNKTMKIYKSKTMSQQRISLPLFNPQKGIWGTEVFPKRK